MAKRNTTPIRSDPNFKRFVQAMKFKKQKQLNKEVNEGRITLAMYRQYQKNPRLIKELEEADLV